MGVWEEYRHDPLGPRVMVRTRTDGGLCNSDPWPCTASTTLFVWAGDQLLWELKSASGTYASAAGGNVSYFHAGGIERLAVTSVDELVAAITAYVENRNRAPKPFVWTATVQHILDKIGKAKQTLGALH